MSKVFRPGVSTARVLIRDLAIVPPYRLARPFARMLVERAHRSLLPEGTRVSRAIPNWQSYSSTRGARTIAPVSQFNRENRWSGPGPDELIGPGGWYGSRGDTVTERIQAVATEALHYWKQRAEPSERNPWTRAPRHDIAQPFVERSHVGGVMTLPDGRTLRMPDFAAIERDPKGHGMTIYEFENQARNVWVLDLTLSAGGRYNLEIMHELPGYEELCRQLMPERDPEEVYPIDLLTHPTNRQVGQAIAAELAAMAKAGDRVAIAAPSARNNRVDLPVAGTNLIIQGMNSEELSFLRPTRWTKFLEHSDGSLEILEIEEEA